MINGDKSKAFIGLKLQKKNHIGYGVIDQSKLLFVAAKKFFRTAASDGDGSDMRCHIDQSQVRRVRKSGLLAVDGEGA